MESIFKKDPTQRPPPSNYEKIEKEISHLKGASVRHKPGELGKRYASWGIITILGVVLGLYFMDPFVYAMKKSDAISIYLYLNNHVAPSATEALISSRIFTNDELRTLNRREGSYQDYYASPQQAEAQAAAIVAYIKGVRDLHNDNYGELSRLNRFRCKLFVHNGLLPPMTWSFLNPSVE